MKRKEDELSVGTVARLQRGLDAPFLLQPLLRPIRAAEGVGAERAIGDDLRDRRVGLRRRLAEMEILHEIHDGQLHAIRNERGMKIGSPQRRVELPQIAGTAEHAEEAEG